MVKKHELMDLIYSGLREAVDPDQVIDIDYERDENNDMIIEFTEVDLQKSKYRIKLEFIS